MKTAFTFKRWYWGDEWDKQPHWWRNFANGRLIDEAIKELYPVAKVRQKSNGSIRVVFNSDKALTLFILKWS